MKINVLFPFRPSADEWRQRNLAHVKAHYQQLPGVHCIITADDPGEMFNRGRALHVAYEKAQEDPADILIFADGDLIVPISRLLEGIEWVKENKGYCVPFSSVRYLPDYATTAVYTGARIEQGFRGIYSWNEKSTGGLNILTPETYERSGGFDPRFADWGFEDAAFDAQVQTLAGPCKWLEGPSYHLYHPSARRGGSPEFNASLALCNRYREAMHRPDLMAQIIGERKHDL